MSPALAAQAGLTIWSYRKPILLLAGIVVAIPLLLAALVAAVFASLAGAGQPQADPLPAAVVTQSFGCTSLEQEPWSATCPSHHFHSGIDLAAPQGTPVHAASSGVVKVGHDRTGYGLFIVVRGDDGLSTLYGHLSRVEVESGDTVAAGDVIGEVGSTGNSTGPHLHFEVRVAGRPVDPLPMLARHLVAGGDAAPVR
jgi:murein DD-endopeptidase MepM/ murein hydrolase activator NlpD